MKAITTALGVGLVACGDDDESKALDCGASGESVSVDGETFCVYAQAVVVENGFDCPAAMPHLTRRPPIGVCADRPDLPGQDMDRIDDRFRDNRPDLYDMICMNSLECGPGEVCVSGACVSGSANNANSTNNTMGCSDNTECGSGELCENGECLGVCGGFAGFTCDDTEWCDYPDDSICGAADQLGVCRVRPDACFEIFDPVCGCDGMDYSNSCAANSGGVDVASEGECQ